MRAMILAAGLGTRLKPLTDTLPKPLVPVGGRPMISYVLDRLEEAGITEVLVNVHYLADKLVSFCAEENQRRKKIKITVQDERAKILGSGGALVKGAPWLFANDTKALFLNADTLIQPDLADFIHQHEASTCYCTMAVMPHAEAGIKYTGLKVANKLVTSFVSKNEKAKRVEDVFHFPGLYILDKRALEQGAALDGDFSVLDKIWKPLLEKKKLGAWLYRGPYQDLGTVEDLQIAEKRIAKGEFTS